jgi:hypothetical protein
MATFSSGGFFTCRVDGEVCTVLQAKPDVSVDGRPRQIWSAFFHDSNKAAQKRSVIAQDFITVLKEAATISRSSFSATSDDITRMMRQNAKCVSHKNLTLYIVSLDPLAVIRGHHLQCRPPPGTAGPVLDLMPVSLILFALANAPSSSEVALDAERLHILDPVLAHILRKTQTFTLLVDTMAAPPPEILCSVPAGEYNSGDDTASASLQLSAFGSSGRSRAGGGIRPNLQGRAALLALGAATEDTDVAPCRRLARGVYIATQEAVRSKRILSEYGITHILSTRATQAGTGAATFPANITHFRFPLLSVRDAPLIFWLSLLNAFIDHAKAAGRVAVSMLDPAMDFVVGASYLIRKRKISAQEAIKEVIHALKRAPPEEDLDFIVRLLSDFETSAHRRRDAPQAREGSDSTSLRTEDIAAFVDSRSRQPRLARSVCSAPNSLVPSHESFSASPSSSAASPLDPFASSAPGAPRERRNSLSLGMKPPTPPVRRPSIGLR